MQKSSKQKTLQKLKSGSISLIRLDGRVKQKLISAITERGLSAKQVAEDAKTFGMTQITQSALSKYFNSDNRVIKGSLTEESLFWLCIRYNIKLSLNVETTKLSMHKRFDRMLSLFDKVRDKFIKDGADYTERIAKIDEDERRNILSSEEVK